MQLPHLSYDAIKQICRAKGFRFFEAGDYNLNLVGIRNTRDLHANTFNDLFCVAFQVRGQTKLLQYACTTDPGIYYRQNPINVNGTAILPAGQHRNLWKIGKHLGQYVALVQNAAVTVIRDPNADKTLDFANGTETGYFGINCHRAREHGTSVQVDKWSAGCQVLASGADFGELMSYATRAAEIYGNSFTYTLFESHEFE